MSTNKKVVIGVLALIVVAGLFVLFLSPTPTSAPDSETLKTATTTEQASGNPQTAPVVPAKPVSKPATTVVGTSPLTVLPGGTTEAKPEAPPLFIRDACAFLTPLKISQIAGVTVDSGISKPSPIGGSNCEFNSDSGSEVVLQIGDKKYAASKNSWAGVVDLPGVGDIAFYQTPEEGSANAVVVQGDLFAQLTIYKSEGTLTVPAVKNLLIYVAGQL